MKCRACSQSDKVQFSADLMAVLDFNDVAGLGAVTTGAALSVLPGTTSGSMPAAGTSGTDTVPAGAKIALVGYVLDTPFVGASVTSLTIKVGDDGSTSRFLAATQILSGATPVTYATGVIANQPFVYTAANTVDAIFVAVGANLSAMSAGQLRLFFQYQDLNVLPVS